MVSPIFGGHGCCRAEIFGRTEARPSKLLSTNRYSPFAVVLARQEPRPPIFLPSLAPLWVGA
ncbi:hypothetical protein Q2T83_01500 [Fervidibacter sacchari]|uniref:Uncharacterized protein n=1 Tax=Candidatus Fervidibacter sacchari TaxID=1448929 RepID=A0ABT2ET46_9BACT|nr:hypothetical protein [Candidatus Fervidibacter sacchari]MCS3921140.1 hypothetical protein [Candidatus Fervidibacter sacchari]WKU16512.1 hypothetical protein Q2T83_01500 [Candidatus Fervidibacter sacchari]